MPSGGVRAADFSHLQLIRRLVDQRVERTHGDDPGQVETAHLDTNSHLDTQTHQRQAVETKNSKRLVHQTFH